MDGFAATVVLMAILLGVLLLVAFAVFCLLHLAAADRVRFLPKFVWAIVIVASPFGGLVYQLSQCRLPWSASAGAECGEQH